MARYRFEPFTFDSDSGQLWRADQLHDVLRPQSARALAYLLENCETLIGREELIEAIWGKRTVVDFEAGLSAVLHDIRKALGDSAQAPRYLQTVPRRGYRFLVAATPVRESRVKQHQILFWSIGLLLLGLAALSGIWVWQANAEPWHGKLAVAPIMQYAKQNDRAAPAWLLTDRLLAELWQRRPSDIRIIGRGGLPEGENAVARARTYGSQLEVDWVLYGQVEPTPNGDWLLRLQLYRMPDSELIWSAEFRGDSPRDEALAKRAVQALASAAKRGFKSN